jgi:hypothetical protein
MKNHGQKSLRNGNDVHGQDLVVAPFDGWGFLA